MQEYVFTIAARDREHPLAARPVIELGFSTSNPQALVAGLQAVVDLLKIKTTPEKVAEFMRTNAILSTILKREGK